MKIQYIYIYTYNSEKLMKLKKVQETNKIQSKIVRTQLDVTLSKGVQQRKLNDQLITDPSESVIRTIEHGLRIATGTTSGTGLDNRDQLVDSGRGSVHCFPSATHNRAQNSIINYNNMNNINLQICRQFWTLF